MRGAVVLLKFVLGLSPAHAVVPVAGESTVGLGDHQTHSEGQKHVGNTMVDNEALHNHGEGSRNGVSPEHAGTVDRAAHEKVADAKLAPEVTPGGCVDQNGERRTFVGAVDFLVASSGPEAAQRGKQAK